MLCSHTSVVNREDGLRYRCVLDAVEEAQASLSATIYTSVVAWKLPREVHNSECEQNPSEI